MGVLPLKAIAVCRKTAIRRSGFCLFRPFEPRYPLCPCLANYEIFVADLILMISEKISPNVTPANPGSGPGQAPGSTPLRAGLELQDSGFRRNDGFF